MRLRLGYIIIAVGVALVVAVLVDGLTRPPAPAVPVSRPAPPGTSAPATGVLPGDMSVEGANVTQRDEQGNPVWSLQAETEMKVDAAKGRAEAENVRWSLQQGTDTEWVVEAPQIVIDYETGRLAFSTGVKVRSADGARQFSVPILRYEPDTKRLIGEGGARFSQGGTVIAGERIVVDTKAKTVRLSGGMRAHIGK